MKREKKTYPNIAQGLYTLHFNIYTLRKKNKNNKQLLHSSRILTQEGEDSKYILMEDGKNLPFVTF